MTKALLTQLEIDKEDIKEQWENGQFPEREDELKARACVKAINDVIFAIQDGL